MYTGSAHHHIQDPFTQANSNEAGPSRITRPPRRCFGNNPERAGVRRFRGLESSYTRVLFSPPVAKADVSEEQDDDVRSSASSPLSTAPSSPLVFSDEEGAENKPVQPLREPLREPLHSKTSSPLSSARSSPLVSCASSPLSSPPDSPSSSRAISSTTHPRPPANASECGSPFDALNAALERLQEQRRLAGRLQSSTSQGKRRRLDSHDDEVRETCPSSPPEPTYHQYTSRSVEKSPAVQRAQRQRRHANRSPVVLTDLGKAGGHRPRAIYPKATTASSPIQPSMTLRRKQQQSVAAAGFPREATPPTSSAALDDLLTASQARPLPPKDHPGRSHRHAQERTSQKAQYQKQDGNVVDLDAIFGDGAMSAEEIRKNTLFIGGASDVDNDAGSQDEDDVVFELLKGRRRRRRGGGGGHDNPNSPDEISRFFASSNKKKKKQEKLIEDDYIRASSSPLAKYSSRRRTSTTTRYSLPPPADLPPTSSYARVKREEGSPTRDIKRVKATRMAARAARTGGAGRVEAASRGVRTKSSTVGGERKATASAVNAKSNTCGKHTQIMAEVRDAHHPHVRNAELASVAQRIRRSMGVVV